MSKDKPLCQQKPRWRTWVMGKRATFANDLQEHSAISRALLTFSIARALAKRQIFNTSRVNSEEETFSNCRNAVFQAFITTIMGNLFWHETLNADDRGTRRIPVFPPDPTLGSRMTHNNSQDPFILSQMLDTGNVVLLLGMDSSSGGNHLYFFSPTCLTVPARWCMNGRFKETLAAAFLCSSPMGHLFGQHLSSSRAQV